MTESAKLLKPKVMLVGLDGATFDNLRPWIDAGHLPTFKRVLAEGVHGPLRSTFPPVTAPAWTSFMTGANPGRHALYHFIEPRPAGYDLRYTNARSRRAKTIWEILSSVGLEVGVINVPMTYPPEVVKGFMVSGMDAPEGSRAITEPKELFDELAARFREVSVQVRYLGYLQSDKRRDALLQSLKEMDEHYLAMTEHLLEAHPVDVAMVVFTSTDTVQHFFYQYFDPQHPQHDAIGAAKYRDAILDVYRRLDEGLRTLLARLPEDTTLIMMSDHGFRSTSGRVLHLNRFLEEAGLLSRRSQKRAPYHPRSLFKSLFRRVDSLLRTTLGPRAKARIADLLPGLRRRWESQYAGFADIDWARTQAYCYEVLTFPPGIWINTKGVRPEGTVAPGAEYEAVVQEVTAKLLAIKDPVTGDALVTRVWRREEIYSGPHIAEAPDLTVSWWDGVTFLTKPSSGDGPVVEYVGGRPLEAGEWGGAHALDGIVSFRGPAFRQGAVLANANIVDVAPTLLHLLGLAVPDTMDGKVLLDAFKEEFRRGRDVHHDAGTGEGTDAKSDDTYSDDEQSQIEERLRGLGYIG